MADNKNDQIEKINKELEDIDKASLTESKHLKIFIIRQDW